MTKQSQRRSIEGLERESRELVRNAIALHPTLPAGNLLEPVLELAEPDFLAELDGMLHAKHFLRVIRAERALALREQREAAWQSPQIREAIMQFPLRVPIGGGKTVAREQLEYPHTARYLSILNREDLARHKKNPKIEAVKALRKLWPRAKRARRMTVSQLDLDLQG